MWPEIEVHKVRAKGIQLRDKKIISRDLIDSPGHNPGMLPDLFSKLKIDTVVAGGMGMRAQELFDQKNINYSKGSYKVDITTKSDTSNVYKVKLESEIWKAKIYRLWV